MDYINFQQQFNIKLNYQQEVAIQTINGPILLLAVPGSGKTTVLVARLGYMLYCCGIQPSEILIMTYTKAATKDMRGRFASIFGNKFANELEFRTINGVSARIIQYYERSKNRTAFQLVGENTLDPMIGDIYRRVTSNFAVESDIKAVKTLITYVKNMCLTELEIEDLDFDEFDFSPIYKEYRRILLDHHWMDYDDQMIYAYQILRQYPDIRHHFQTYYHYLCVDEAQDTSKIQHLLIQLLAQGHKNLFMVGDEDQSIYGFRAAYPAGLLEFELVYPGASVLLMEKNYRSTKQIVMQADRIIKKNRNRHPKRILPSRGDGKPIEQLIVHDRNAQYSYLANIAQHCHHETAVLYRDNDSALPIIDILNRKGIPYRCRQIESSFFHHYIVRDITDIMRFAFDQTDGECFQRIYYKFCAGFSKAAATAALLNYRKTHGSLLQSLQEIDSLSQWSRTQAKDLQIQLDHLRNESAEEAIKRIMYAMGYANYLKERNADQNKVGILLSIASNENTSEQFLLRLNELCEIVKHGSTDADCNFILSTIHSSKGLEYDRVILLDVLDGILPRAVMSTEKMMSQDDLEALEEERRLFYVAITRAKEELSLFRYTKKVLTSSFADELFPPKPEQTVISISGQSKPKQLSNYSPEKDVTAIAKDYIVQRRVVHKSFGPGTIENKNGTIITVHFDNETIKKFDLISCLKKGYFSCTNPNGS